MTEHHSRRGMLERLESRHLLTASAIFAAETLELTVADSVSFEFVDLDGDNHSDVVSHAAASVSWHRSENKDGQYTKMWSLDISAKYVELIDIDSDTQLDLVFADLSDRLFWVRNRGGGDFESEPRVLTNVQLSDLNGDETVDLLFSSPAGMGWYRNSNGSFTGPENTVSQSNVYDADIADADDDGDMDIVALQIKEGDRVIEWFENDDATFANSHPILTAATHVDSILAGDINHDGLMDVAVERSAANQSPSVTVYASAAGHGNLREHHLPIDDISVLAIADSNDDSHADLLAVRSNETPVTFDFRVIGDIDGSGAFDSSDLTQLFQTAHYEDSDTGNSSFRNGDWNGDGEFESDDLVLAFQAGTYERLTHPRLFFTAADVPDLRAKLTTRQAQYQREIELALKQVDVDYSDRSLYETDKARDGQRFAFLALIMNDSDPLQAKFAGQARDVLSNANEGRWRPFAHIPDRPATFDLSEALHPWNTGEVLMNLSLMYDWLVGAGELKGVARQDARFRILRLTQLEHHQQTIPFAEYNHSKYPFRVANYAFRSVSGVGFASVAFPNQIGIINDPYDRLPSEFATPFNTHDSLDWVLRELFDEITTSSASDPANGQSLVGHYISEEGFVREGTTYELDSYGVLIPFLVTLDRQTGVDYFSSDGPTDGRILETFNTNTKLSLPNGYRPLTGDSFLGNHYLWAELAAAYADNPESHLAEAGTVTTHFGISLPFYDDSIPERLTEYRTEFLPDSGLAVFRDGSDRSSTYLLLTARKGSLRGHIQADQASISLFANEAHLITENGYSAAYNKAPDARPGGKTHWIASALGHSTMTIDSLYRVDDTPEVDIRYDELTPRVSFSYSRPVDSSYIENTLATEMIDYAEAHVDYTSREANLVRAVVFPRHRYFILEDTMTSDETHDYGWQLQLGRTETGEFSGNNGEYVWTAPNAYDNSKTSSLGVYMLDDEGRNVSVYGDGPTNRTGYGYPGQVYDHTYILADRTAEDLRFVTLLDPFASESEKLDVETVAPGKVWKVNHSPGSYDLILSQDESNPILFDEVATNAKFAVVSIDVIDGTRTVTSILARDGTHLQVGYDQQKTLEVAGDSVFQFSPD